MYKICPSLKSDFIKESLDTNKVLQNFFILNRNFDAELQNIQNLNESI